MNIIDRAIKDLESFCLHHESPSHCPLDELSPLALAAWEQTPASAVPTPSGVRWSGRTMERLRAELAVERLRAGWRPTCS